MTLHNNNIFIVVIGVVVTATVHAHKISHFLKHTCAQKKNSKQTKKSFFKHCPLTKFYYPLTQGVKKKYAIMSCLFLGIKKKMLTTFLLSFFSIVASSIYYGSIHPNSNPGGIPDGTTSAGYVPTGSVRITAFPASTHIAVLATRDSSGQSGAAYPGASIDGVFTIKENQLLLRRRNVTSSTFSDPEVISALNGEGAQFFGAKYSNGEQIPSEIATRLLQENFAVAGVAMSGMHQRSQMKKNSGVTLAVKGVFKLPVDQNVSVGDMLGIEFPAPGSAPSASAQGIPHTILPRIVVTTPQTYSVGFRDLIESYTRDPKATAMLLSEAGRPLQTEMQNSVHSVHQAQLTNAVISAWWLIKEGYLTPTQAFQARLIQEEAATSSPSIGPFASFTNAVANGLNTPTRGALGWGLNGKNDKLPLQYEFDRDAWRTAIGLARVLMITPGAFGLSSGAPNFQSNLLTRLNLLNALNPSRSAQNAFYNFGFSFSPVHRVANIRDPTNPSKILTSTIQGAILAAQMNSTGLIIGACLSAYIHFSSSAFGVALSNARQGGNVDVFVNVAK